MTENSDSERDVLKFADEFRTPVLEGEKTATLRLDLDSRAFPVGDRFLLATADGTPFASAVVSTREYTSVEMAAKMDIDGHQSYASTDELLDQFNGYYPDLDIGPNTRVELIRWEYETLTEVNDE